MTPVGMRLAPQRALKRLRNRWPGALRAVEIIVFASTLPVLARALAGDPDAGSGFSWAALGPVVLAARYGVAQGVACALCAALVLALLGGENLAVPAIGTLVLATLVGDAASGWRRRALQADAENDYLRHRLKEFSNDYHVLKLSHGQLEEFVVGQRLSLRTALQALRPALATRNASRQSGEELMAVFAQFCSVQVAALHAMKNETLVEQLPLAVLGGMDELPAFDPLLRLAVREKRLISVKPDAMAGNRHGTGLLAVVPIVDSRDRLHAVLAIRDMHFMAFQQKNLDTLALLAGYIGDRIAHTGSLDESPAEHFLTELDTALRFVRTHGVEAMLLSLNLVSHRLRERIAERLSEDIRRLDCAWRLPPRNGRDDDCTVAVLLPLVGRDGASAWLERVSAGIADELGVELREVIASARCLRLSADHDRRQALAFIAGSEIGGASGAEEVLFEESVHHAA